ncbi:MAG: cell division protein ZapA [Oscillospiraceae bacterium]|nr:cell division protein ZapA [Oscillospiraceae bacterium]
MANRITVSICGEEYTLMAEESQAYMQKVAALVDTRMSEMMMTGRVSRMDAAVLAAANMADEMLKQQNSNENLRKQLKGYHDEAKKAQDALSDCKREIFKLQQQLEKLKKKDA